MMYCPFRSQFGEFEINVEQGKKENRSDIAYATTVDDFLEVCCSFQSKLI